MEDQDSQLERMEIILMRHGIINRFIAKEPIAPGWKEQTRPGKGYWGAGVYSVV